MTKPIRREELYEALKSNKASTIESAIIATKSTPLQTKSAVFKPATVPLQASPIFDKVGALARLDEDMNFLREMGLIFLEKCPALREELCNALPAGDADRTRRAAHALKGNLGTLGATRANRSAQEVETLATQGDTIGISPAAINLELETDKFVDLLAQFVIVPA